MTTPAIMGFHPPGGAVVGADSIGPMYDSVYGRMFAGSQTASAVGFRYYDAWPNGVQIIEAALSALGGFTNNGGPLQFRANAQQIASAPQGANGAKLSYVTATELTLAGSFGTNDSSFANDTVHIEGPRRGCCIQGNVTILNAQRTSGAINAITNNVNAYLGNVDENYTEVGATPEGLGSQAYVIGYTKLGGATQVGFYTATGLALHSVAKILATDVDATWTHIDTCYGISVDQTDGNPIAGFFTLDSVTNPAYLAKINKLTGVIMWALPVGSGINYDNGMKFNVIKNGRLWYIESGAAHTLHQINTIAGTQTTQTIDAAQLDSLHGDQCSEDVTDSVMWLGSWSESTTHPNYLGDYMLTQGNHSGSGMIFRYFPNGTPNPPPVYGVPAESRKRAWTFTFDGHTFYVLDLGSQGTWCLDVSTGEWSQFITEGYGVWNIVNGVQWDQRIVGGDSLLSTVYELVPSQTKDKDGTLDITHIVTGGLVKRNRVFTSVEAFRLNVSVGQLDDAATATVQLSFSDDQGKTWVDMDTYTLTSETFSDELVWRSLGSFAAPGRIFRVTDVGGFIRIDGADAGMDNFDDDKVQDTGGGQGG